MNKEDFEVTAFFYNSNNLKFRRYLDIKRKKYLGETIDLNVIMMNPGSSKPKNIDENINSEFLNKFVPAHPDPTQYQIMKIMENCNFNYARIVNLSDVRNGSSTEFYKLLDNELKDTNHSIFHCSNEEHLLKHLNFESIFILAWGVNPKLNKLAENAINKIQRLVKENTKIFGIRHPNNKFGFYHPLPKTEKAQIDWIEQITNQIKTTANTVYKK